MEQVMLPSEKIKEDIYKNSNNNDDKKNNKL